MLISLPFFFLLIDCKDDIEPNLCLPLSLVVNSDSLTFEYSNKRLATIYYYYRNTKSYMAKLDVSYNTNGTISKTDYYNIFNGLTTVAIKDEFHYSSEQLADTMKRTLLGGGGISQLLVFKHDQNKRLTEIIWDQYAKIRYEYNSSGNISNIFLTGGVERLAIENLEFDNNSTFYSNSKELKFILEYRHMIMPNKNNCVKMKITNWYERSILVSPSILSIIQNQYPITVNYLYAYNDKGAPIQRSVESAQTPQNDFTFQKVKYTCE